LQEYINGVTNSKKHDVLEDSKLELQLYREHFSRSSNEHRPALHTALMQVKDKLMKRGKAESPGGMTAHVPDVFRCCCGVPDQEGRCREPRGKRASLHCRPLILSTLFVRRWQPNQLPGLLLTCMCRATPTLKSRKSHRVGEPAHARYRATAPATLPAVSSRC
jgi:hypothetical protein